MRTYQTPIAFKAALDHRLREAARQRGTSLDRLRQLIVFDRFIARAMSIFGERCVLKGGVVIELRLGRARTTKDIDVYLSGSPDTVLEQLREAALLDLDDFFEYQVTPDPKHPVIAAG